MSLCHFRLRVFTHLISPHSSPLTLPFPPSLHLSHVHNHPSSSNQHHLNPQPPRPTTPTPDTSSPRITQLSTLDCLDRQPRAQHIKPLRHPALDLNRLDQRPQCPTPQVPALPGPRPSTALTYPGTGPAQAHSPSHPTTSDS